VGWVTVPVTVPAVPAAAWVTVPVTVPAVPAAAWVTVPVTAETGLAVGWSAWSVWFVGCDVPTALWTIWVIPLPLPLLAEAAVVVDADAVEEDDPADDTLGAGAAAD
jgi:hypothetical protein